MIILVTGGAGFLGIRLVRRLLNDGHEVRAIDQTPMPSILSDLHGLKWIQCDLSRETPDAEEVLGVDAVFHLAGATLGAGSDEQMFCSANEATTVGLLKECAGKVKRIVHASSQVVYGNIDHLSITEDFPLAGFDSAYACSKVNAENWLRWFQTKRGGAYITLRFSGFIEGGGAIDYMIGQALKNKPIELFSNGRICRDYLPVDKGIEALISTLAQNNNAGIAAYNIGSGHAIPTLEIAKIVCAETNSTSVIVPVDKPAARSNFVFDITKARSELGFEPGSLAEAVQAYVRRRISGKDND